MLAVNPDVRAPLSEVLNHPWMVRGFNGPPDALLLHREPLRVDELEKQVICGMTGFGFDSEEEIERQLIQILNSDGYHRAVQVYERKRVPGDVGRLDLHGENESPSNSSLTISHAISTSSNKLEPPPTTAKPKKRFAFDFCRRRFFKYLSLSHGDPPFQSHIPNAPDPPTIPQKNKPFLGFGFYWRKLFSSGSSPPGSQSPSQSHSSQDCHIDPTNGYHPLISMYFLTREKLERERVYGPGSFASSGSPYIV